MKCIHFLLKYVSYSLFKNQKSVENNGERKEDQEDHY